MKRCSKCGETKRLEEFSKDRSKKDGLQTKCKACSAAYKAENREKQLAYQAAHYAANRDKKAAYDAAYRAANRDKKTAYDAAYRAANRDKKAAYYAATRDKRLAYQATYQAENREQIAAYQRARRRTDPWFRICRNLRSRQCQFWKGTLRSASMVREIGCDRDFFLRHIESQFNAGMTQDNYGTVWHLDHIFPLARVDKDDPMQVRAAFNWRNLQPMLGPENLAKSDAVTPEAQRLFDELVREFAQQRGVA